MYTRAKTTQDERLKLVTKWDDVVPTLDAKNILVLPWCEQEQCEDDIKERSKSQYVPVSLLLSHKTDVVGQTRERQKMSKLLRQELNPSVSHMIKLDSESSQRAKTRNVSSVVKRQRGGLCLEGVSFPFALWWGESADE